MRVELQQGGVLVVTAENELEAVALELWNAKYPKVSIYDDTKGATVERRDAGGLLVSPQAPVQVAGYGTAAP